MQKAQKNIKNLKDPTLSCWAFPRQQQAATLLLLLVLAALSWGTELCQASFLTDERRVRRDYYNTGRAADEPRQNVSCIAHDAKYTCDCQNVHKPMQLPQLIGSVFQVEISNCKSLIIEANTLSETLGLRKINFKNLDHLVLKRYALAFPRYASNTPLIIEFEKVNFETIESHAIDGNIEEISFIGGRIDVIHPFGFTTLKDRAILLRIDNVFVRKIEPQAFKKFAVEQMEITNCIFDSNVPSKAFYELEVLQSLRINNVKFKAVHSRAFSFKMISRLSITNNYFDSVDAEWIEAHVRESVTIRDNYFGVTSPIAFKGITVHRDYIQSEKLEMRFINNTVSFPLEPRSLEFNERFALSVKQLQYENQFTCNDLETTQKPPRPKIVFFQTHIDNVYFRREEGGTIGDSKSTLRRGNQSFVVLSKIIESDCQRRSYLLYIILGVIALVLVLILIVVIIWWQLMKKRKRRKMDVVQPEPRTYKETQIIYQIENAGLLRTDM